MAAAFGKAGCVPVPESSGSSHGVTFGLFQRSLSHLCTRNQSPWGVAGGLPVAFPLQLVAWRAHSSHHPVRFAFVKPEQCWSHYLAALVEDLPMVISRVCETIILEFRMRGRAAMQAGRF